MDSKLLLVLHLTHGLKIANFSSNEAFCGLSMIKAMSVPYTDINLMIQVTCHSHYGSLCFYPKTIDIMLG